MATNEQSYKIGEAKGQTQEKAGQIFDGVKDTAEQAKNKAFDTAEAAKAKVSGEKTAGDHVNETAQAAKAKVTGEKTAGDRVNETAQTARDTAQTGAENTGNAFTATGDKIKEVAGGTVDAVKNTFGMK